MGTLVSYQLDGPVATITMDDGKVNVLSPQMLGEIEDALDRAAADQAVVVLTGRPGTFCAGSTCRCSGRAAAPRPAWSGRVSSWPGESCHSPSRYSSRAPGTP
jgi:enoyl-CoA hydratase/carnithine racemase